MRCSQKQRRSALRRGHLSEITHCFVLTPRIPPGCASVCVGERVRSVCLRVCYIVALRSLRGAHGLMGQKILNKKRWHDIVELVLSVFHYRIFLFSMVAKEEVKTRQKKNMYKRVMSNAPAVQLPWMDAGRWTEPDRPALLAL